MVFLLLKQTQVGDTLKKPLRIATVAFVVFALAGCSNYDFNALGFASKADMDDAHSKGYHTKKKLDEMVIKSVEKVVAALAAPISSVAAKPDTKGESNGVRDGVTSKGEVYDREQTKDREPSQPATTTAPQDSLSINIRWLGVWRSGSADKLTISATKFGDCQWVKNETAAQKKCLAYYRGKITKKELAADINKDLNSLSGWLQQKVISAADFQKMKAVSESYKKILDEISDDTFRTIFVDYGEVGSPDAFTNYFLDKDYVYQTTRVVGPIAPAFSIIKYRKQ